MKVLVLGGYGTFGARLVRLLAAESRLTLVVAGRSSSRAARFVAQHAVPGGATLEPTMLDRRGDLDGALERLEPAVLVDASGPFQDYGDDAYRVVEACLRHRVHYLDLADGADFVSGIARHDAQARKQGIFAISGVSTLPALSFAVVRHLSEDCSPRIEPRSIVAGIAPSPYAGVGPNVVRAILGYAGKPVRRWDGGREAEGTGLVDSMTFSIAPPAGVPLGPRRFSLVDVPDYRLAPASCPQLQAIWIGAAPAPSALHRALSMLARLVQLRMLPSLVPLARLAHWTCDHIRWGEARGGMFVRVAGRTAEGEDIERTWHLVAEGDDGPFIPSMGVAVLLQRLLAGQQLPRGARPCTSDLTLADYEAFFAARNITHGTRSVRTTRDGPVYERVLGSAWRGLPDPIRRLHGERGEREFDGIVRVERGRGIAFIAGTLAGFPASGDEMPLHVAFEADTGLERWVRDFGTRRVRSVQWAGRAGAEGLLCERMGPMGLRMALVVEGARLRFVLRGWNFLGVPMPRFLGPTVDSWEEASGGDVRFLVEIGHPLIGMIVRYGGTHQLRATSPGDVRHEATQSSVM
ncbi:MAG TPA: DUF4166 domain-containing protein [Usitatibacter sp.]|jgi:hypothetical protein|nr:DUF4166 domain-containing protein [Usitatibacter sp.]